LKIKEKQKEIDRLENELFMKMIRVPVYRYMHEVDDPFLFSILTKKNRTIEECKIEIKICKKIIKSKEYGW